MRDLREVGGTVKYALKGGGTEQSGGIQRFRKRGGKLGQGVGPLKVGDWNPLKNYG